MKRKQVWRYYCDFCKKANCSRYSITEHEKHCTNNPNRVCRMCNTLEQRQPPLAALIAILPQEETLSDNRTDEQVWHGHASRLETEMSSSLPLLRARSGNCPACMLAALRQAKIPLPLNEFDFEAECRAIFEQLNADRNSEYAQ